MGETEEESDARRMARYFAPPAEPRDRMGMTARQRQQARDAVRWWRLDESIDFTGTPLDPETDPCTT